jgi:hypothetical protein
MDMVEFVNVCALADLLFFFRKFELFYRSFIDFLLSTRIWNWLDHLPNQLLALESLGG